MRVLLTIDIYDPARGGASEDVCALASWLSQRGHQVGILCDRADVEAPPDCQIISPLGKRSDCPWERASRLQFLANQQNTDLIHDTGACLLASDIFHPKMGSRLHNEIRQLWSFPPRRALGYLLYAPLWQTFRLQLHQMRNHRCLVACSQQVADDFAQLGVSTTALIRNGIDLPPPRAAGELAALRARLGATGRLMILMSSNNHFLKGVLNLLRAISLMSSEKRARWRVVVAGKVDAPDFQSFIDRHSLNDCCLLAGWVADIEPYYQAADLLLHPTYHDAGSLSVLKALASGCAVATTSLDGSSEVITDGVNGLILKSNRPRELLAALERLADDQTRIRLGAAARTLAPSLCQELGFTSLERLYLDILAGARPPTPGLYS